MLRLLYTVFILGVALPSSCCFQCPARLPHSVARVKSRSNILDTPTFDVSFVSQIDSKRAATSTADGEWTKKRLHNTASFRSLTLLTALLFAGFSSRSQQLLPSQAMATLHMLSFGTWFGTVAYTTFVAGITMFKNLPRQTFGKLQAKLFPKYFSLSSVAIVLQLISLKKLSALSASTAHSSARALGVALIMTLVNQYYLEPSSTNNMMERYDLERAGEEQSDRYKELKASFGKFHGMSSLANLVALCGGVAHAVYLASSLVKP